jgi:MoaA/NifB/PqqE/SkfB family radical SAM enzyme
MFDFQAIGVRIMTKVSTIVKTAAARFGKPSPLALTYELTHQCNLKCIYCDRHAPLPNELSRDDIFRVLADFVEMGMWKANLDGGDPLTHRYIDDIVEWLADRRISTRMNTNGILIPKKIETIRKLRSVKISLDGPKEYHESMRGRGSFDKALNGALAAREAGVPKVEFTCVVGQHNFRTLNSLIDMVEELGFSIIFQPLRNSLFQNTERDGTDFMLKNRQLQEAFTGIEKRKRATGTIANRWSSLRHFRKFPEDTPLPCSAGWISVTMDPEGNLYHCGQVNRRDKSFNVLRLGVRAAFEELPRYGCSQCWCARTVEGNYKWGAHIHKMIPP